MKITTRTQVYWRNERLYPIKNSRPSGLGRWPLISEYHQNELVAIIEGDLGNIKITEGPLATSERVNQALLFHRDITPESISREVWSRIPTSLRASISARVSGAESAVSDLWGQFSNEEAVTGAFFSRLNESFRQNGWEVKISFVEFSKQTKEPQTGTDVAVIVDALSNDGKRSFKTMWFQAKSTGSWPFILSSLPRMDSQLILAEKFCEASYGLIYTPQGIFVLDGEDTEPQPFHTTLDRCIQCQRGDTSVAVLKNSLNRKKLLQIVLTEESASTESPPSKRRIRIR